MRNWIVMSMVTHLFFVLERHKHTKICSSIPQIQSLKCMKISLPHKEIWFRSAALLDDTLEHYGYYSQKPRGAMCALSVGE